ncbi:Hypothetical_protein [Hexamita inflata]|uniref:Hypothetical_protein n=1 Tax=Hexamita inflata TaxID=28002 RepID=A0AA86Q6W1_9EUKA|nr:Hypothetical protein HINF_LOCUS41060 [Hexamita inflata]
MQKIFMWLERKYFLIALIQISILRQSPVLTSEINSFPFAAKRFDIYSSSYQIQTLIPNFLARHKSYECSKTRANADVPSAVPCSFNRSAATQVGAQTYPDGPRRQCDWQLKQHVRAQLYHEHRDLDPFQTNQRTEFCSDGTLCLAAVC